MSKKITQTAGRSQLGDFAPMFAHLNDDVLFGEVWNEEAIDVKTKCIVTVVSLMASGITSPPSSPTPPCMWAGPRAGRYSAWPRRSGTRQSPCPRPAAAS